MRSVGWLKAQRVCAATVVLLWSGPIPAPRASAPPQPTLPLVDEAPRDPAFLAFRTELQQAVASRDANALINIVHPHIRISFGDDNGIEAFKRVWQVNQHESQLWQALSGVLALGGTFTSPDTFVAPYVNSRWPEELDPFDHVAVIGSGVRVRAEPSSAGRVVRTLSYSILRIGGTREYPQQPWTAVVLPDGRRGYVSSHLVRSPIDYRAFFVRTDGQWLMSAFIAGD